MKVMKPITFLPFGPDPGGNALQAEVVTALKRHGSHKRIISDRTNEWIGAIWFVTASFAPIIVLCVVV